MKKRGILAFIIYIFSCIIAAGVLIYAYIEAQKIPEPDVEGWGAWGVSLLVVLALIIGIPSGTSIILKFLHLVSHKKFFVLLCIALDLVAVLYLAGVHRIFTYNLVYWIEGLGVDILGALIPLSALISNAGSLAD